MTQTTFTDDRKQALAYFSATPATGDGSVARRSREDFGGPDSLRLHVRRRDIDHFKMDWVDGGYGLYLGRHGDKWVVGIKNLLATTLIGYVAYDSLDELKQNWELD